MEVSASIEWLGGNLGYIPSTQKLWTNSLHWPSGSKSWAFEGSAGQTGFQALLGKTYSLKPYLLLLLLIFVFMKEAQPKKYCCELSDGVEFVMLDLD